MSGGEKFTKQNKTKNVNLFVYLFLFRNFLYFYLLLIIVRIIIILNNNNNKCYCYYYYHHHHYYYYYYYYNHRHCFIALLMYNHKITKTLQTSTANLDFFKIQFKSQLQFLSGFFSPNHAVLFICTFTNKYFSSLHLSKYWLFWFAKKHLNICLSFLSEYVIAFPGSLFLFSDVVISRFSGQRGRLAWGGV